MINFTPFKGILGIALFFSSQLALQAQMPKGQFFSFGHIMANFCQIDGDQAGGFNKFGYTGGFQVGQGIGKGFVYETGIGFSVRGSRRPLNPDNLGLQSFNLDYRMIDIPLKIMKYHKKITFGAGLITTLTLRAKDIDNYILHLDTDTRKVNILGCLAASYNLSPNVRLSGEYQYSLNSIRISNNSNNPFFRTGVYHNVISIGIDYVLSVNKK